MLKSNTALFVIFSIFVLSSADPVLLTPQNFLTVVNGKHNVLVNFFAPWCPHCKKLEPEYEKLANSYPSGNAEEIIIAKIDASNYREFSSSKFKIEGYPTLILFLKGDTDPVSTQGFKYTGIKDAANIKTWILGKIPKSEPKPQLSLVPVSKTDSQTSEVIILDDRNFNATVTNKDMILVEFYAPWCPHCQKFAPEYAKAASTLKGIASLGTVNCVAEVKLCEKYYVDRFPTLKLFKNGQDAALYQGKRTAAGVIRYMKRIKNPIESLASIEEAERALTEYGQTLIIGLFDSKSSPEYTIFEKAANNLFDRYNFAVSFNKAVFDHFKMVPPTIFNPQPSIADIPDGPNTASKAPLKSNIFTKKQYNAAALEYWIKQNAVMPDDNESSNVVLYLVICIVSLVALVFYAAIKNDGYTKKTLQSSTLNYEKNVSV